MTRPVLAVKVPMVCEGACEGMFAMTVWLTPQQAKAHAANPQQAYICIRCSRG